LLFNKKLNGLKKKKTKQFTKLNKNVKAVKVKADSKIIPTPKQIQIQLQVRKQIQQEGRAEGNLSLKIYNHKINRRKS